MALQPDIQYVPFYYVDGSAARKVTQKKSAQTVSAPVPAPRRRQSKRKTVAVDPVAIGGLLVVMVLLVSMVAGFVEYRTVQNRNAQMSQYISELEQQNSQLQQEYENGYDLEDIQDIAGVLGMVPAEEAEQITIEVAPAQQEQMQMSFWESITTFLAGLFA